MAGNASFDLYSLPDEYKSLRQTVREIAEEQIAPHAHDVDEHSRFPKEAHDALRAADLLAPHIPEEYGGAGADALASVIIIEEISRVCVSSSLLPGVNKLGTLPLILFGSHELNSKYLPPVARGDAMFSYCLSEPEDGSDAGGMRTKAVRDGDHYVLNGAKRWITNAGESEYYTTMAVTDPAKGTRGGITAFVVEKSDPGVSFGAPERKLGIKGSPTREVFYDDVRIPADRMIGEEGQGFVVAMKTLDHTRITIGAQAIGVAQGALDHAVAYMKERKQFGKPISDFQGLQFMLADMAMQIEAARSLTYQAAAKSERGEPDVGYFGAAAKCFASDVAMKVTTDAVQLLGGYGYVKDYPLERMMRDAKITQIYEGTNQIQRLVIARALIKG
ncbi:MAG TPA: acyl-CoA dehydrogenase [Sporichthyaceae bacterium]|nr:acyl-CoA dehydrogenase [Sporichthyaceae bacterium]